MKKYLIVIIILIIGGFFGNLLRYNEQMPDHEVNFSVIPVNYAGYNGVEQQLQDFAVDVLKADRTSLRDYFKNNHRLQLFLAYFRSQKYGSQIHSPKHCLPGGGWRIDNIVPHEVNINGTLVSVNLMYISVQNYKAVMMYWYETRSGRLRSEYGLKFDLVKNALMFEPTDAVIVRLTIDASDGRFQDAVDWGEEFLQEFYPFIQKSLPFQR